MATNAKRTIKIKTVKPKRLGYYGKKLTLNDADMRRGAENRISVGIAMGVDKKAAERNFRREQTQHKNSKLHLSFKRRLDADPSTRVYDVEWEPRV
jgi:hypothetical protein